MVFKMHYENHPEFNLSLRMLPALAHLPLSHVKAAFELVIDDITDVIESEGFDTNVIEKTDELTMYFKNTYIENPLPNRSTQFPIEIWNQSDAAIDGVARTTNSVEGWHYGLQSYFTGVRPNVWHLIKNLQKDANVQKFKYIQETAGKMQAKRAKYEKIKKEVQAIRGNFNEKDIIPYLRAIAKFR